RPRGGLRGGLGGHALRGALALAGGGLLPGHERDHGHPHVPARGGRLLGAGPADDRRQARHARLLRPGLPEAPQVPGSSRAHPPKSSPRPEEAHGEWELLRLHPRGLGRGVGGTALPPSCPELGSRSSPWGPGALGGWAGPWGACPPDSRGRGVGPEHLLPSRQDEEQMSTGIYTPKWFLQCFLGRTPFSLTLKLWDAYVLDGERVLTAMAYTILKVHRSK
uniref:Rab-GAP TBC domain-containing protein n=1 Tax=Canis lupus familiaris TaxID=9615 RepID=A0A8C0RGP1_CANLF